MTNYLLPPFGQINLASLNEEYNAVVELDGHSISLDINFEKTTIEENLINIIKQFIENIPKFDKQNIVSILNEYNDENGETVKRYIDFHIEEYAQSELVKLIDYGNTAIAAEEQLLNKLKLERVGFYPDGKYDAESFAIFDYTFEGNVYLDGVRTITDQIIAVKTDSKGELEYLAWES
ncbi:DUF2004 domain-containing protein [Hymenobacter negativus]|uniref:DUF2004 domain-containing protein n=1 Tax=Hymenobacter negativus TaxID=2795026 RepID=A0ABS3QC83_9BACT|nr:DUF2004 domain-containing protein [Hymenobacter negativus]MBO2008849.1 DUF2004 domain-containing protein [Hymenobacter negativus]